MPNPRARFLAHLEEDDPRQAVRLAPPLDALIAWSEANGLEAVPPPPRSVPCVRYRVPGSPAPLWTVMPRAKVGAVLVVMAGAGFEAGPRCRARTELARIEGKPADTSQPPEVSLGKLVWGPHRTAVLVLLATLVAELAAPA